MTTFVQAVSTQESRTANGMRAKKGTGSSAVDLFFKIGAMRGHDVSEILSAFVPAFHSDEDRAVRILQWARDVRGGAGEREIYRTILQDLAHGGYDNIVIALIDKTPELGRWDDLLVLYGTKYWTNVVEAIRFALQEEENGLCAKWMPRKGLLAASLRNALGWTPKFYRKRLVELTTVVEQKMCANDWDNINFEHVPSIAHNKYRRAFERHTNKYEKYVGKVESGEAKISADAIFPHDIVHKILKGRGIFGRNADTSLSSTERRSIIAQWEALPNYIKEANVLPLVDVSGSMFGGFGSSIAPIDVAVGLGLYFADKNHGKFADTFLTFSGSPELVTLKGDIFQKVQQMSTANWHMNTNLHAAFEKILKVALQGKVPQKEMPDTLFILSDMQFDSCVRHDDSAIKMIKRKYEEAGYKLPNVVFWNINAADNVPVKFSKKGVALVSGFSPAICKTILESTEKGDLSPDAVMDRTIFVSRYDW